MRIRERYELAEELRYRYRGWGRVERGQLLDSFCLATGYGRKYAIKVLRGGVQARVPCLLAGRSPQHPRTVRREPSRNPAVYL
jgi:hypothetical protein